MLRKLVFPTRLTGLSRCLLQSSARSFTTSQIDAILNRVDSEIHAMKVVDLFKIMIDARHLNIRFDKFHPHIDAKIDDEEDKTSLMKFILSNLSSIRNVHHNDDYLFVLNAITPRLDNIQFSSQELLQAVQSLRGLTVTTTPELQPFIRILSERIHACKDEFDAEDLRTTLQVLDSLGTGVGGAMLDVTQQPLTMVIPLSTATQHSAETMPSHQDVLPSYRSHPRSDVSLERHRGPSPPRPPSSFHMSPDHFSMAIFGLKNILTPDSSTSVKALLCTLPKRLQEYRVWRDRSNGSVWSSPPSSTAIPTMPAPPSLTWSAHNISQILLGINQLSSTDPVIRTFLRTVVVPALQNCDPSGFSSPLYLRSTVFALRHMSSDHAEVRIRSCGHWRLCKGHVMNRLHMECDVMYERQSSPCTFLVLTHVLLFAVGWVVLC